MYKNFYTYVPVAVTVEFNTPTFESEGMYRWIWTWTESVTSSDNNEPQVSAALVVKSVYVALLIGDPQDPASVVEILYL